MEEHTFSLGYKMGGVMDSTLMHINDLPIPIPIPIHQRGLISSVVDYSSLTRVQEDTCYGTDRCWYKYKKTNTTIFGMFQTLNKRCKLSDFTNYISNASNLQERVVSNTYSKSKRQFKISKENVIRSIPAYDIVIGKRKDKAVRLFYRQKPTKENVKG